MKFLCMVRFDPSDEAVVAEVRSEAFSRACLAHDEELEREGRLVVAQALEAPANAVMVRVRRGRLSTTDGPFVETKEQVGGLVVLEARDRDEAVVLEARDRDEAVALAARMPFARIGCVEVRALPETGGRWPASKGGRRGIG